MNLGFLSFDIYLAHSINRFEHEAEYIRTFWFSLAAPPLLLLALLFRAAGVTTVWRDVGHLVGWCAIVIGLIGVVLHLDSRFFYERTIKSLVYAAPFAAPLAYTGLGLLLVMNRMVDALSEEWPRWVLLLGLGGVFGNFVFSLTDHAHSRTASITGPNGSPSSGSAASPSGFLAAIFMTPVSLCALSRLMQPVMLFDSSRRRHPRPHPPHPRQSPRPRPRRLRQLHFWRRRWQRFLVPESVATLRHRTLGAEWTRYGYPTSADFADGSSHAFGVIATSVTVNRPVGGCTGILKFGIWKVPLPMRSADGMRIVAEPNSLLPARYACS